MVRLNKKLEQSTMRQRAFKMKLNAFCGGHLFLGHALIGRICVLSGTCREKFIFSFGFRYQLEIASNLGIRACADILLPGTQ